MWKAHKYYRGELAEGDTPPDACIEIALWDRFGWGPEQTNALSMNDMRIMFAVMEQERISRHSIEKLGAPDTERMRAKQQAARAAELRGETRGHSEDDPVPETNAKVIRRNMRNMGG